MDWKIDYNEAADYVKVTCTGVFSISGHNRCAAKLFSSPFWKPGMRLIFDNRTFDFGKINLTELRSVSLYFENMKDQLGDGKVALLMKSPHDFGIGRQFEMISDDRLQCEICVFYEEQKALDWLLEDSF